MAMQQHEWTLKRMTDTSLPFFPYDFFKVFSRKRAVELWVRVTKGQLPHYLFSEVSLFFCPVKKKQEIPAISAVNFYLHIGLWMSRVDTVVISKAKAEKGGG